MSEISAIAQAIMQVTPLLPGEMGSPGGRPLTWRDELQALTGKLLADLGADAAADMYGDLAAGGTGLAMLVGPQALSHPRHKDSLEAAQDEATRRSEGEFRLDRKSLPVSEPLSPNWTDNAIRSLNKYGWFQTPDRRWQRWIQQHPDPRPGSLYALSRLDDKTSYRLGDLIDSEVFAEYPRLRELVVTAKHLPDAAAQYNHDRGLITISKSGKRFTGDLDAIDYQLDDFSSDVAHELQHAVSRIEGFSTGASPEWYRWLIKNRGIGAGLAEDKVLGLASHAERGTGKDWVDSTARMAYRATLDETRARTAERYWGIDPVEFAEIIRQERAATESPRRDLARLLREHEIENFALGAGSEGHKLVEQMRPLRKAIRDKSAPIFGYDQPVVVWPVGNIE